MHKDVTKLLFPAKKEVLKYRKKNNIASRIECILPGECVELTCNGKLRLDVDCSTYKFVKFFKTIRNLK